MSGVATFQRIQLRGKPGLCVLHEPAGFLLELALYTIAITELGFEAIGDSSRDREVDMFGTKQRGTGPKILSGCRRSLSGADAAVAGGTACPWESERKRNSACGLRTVRG